MRLIDWLLPKKCFLCGEIISGEGDLCPACEKKLPTEPFRRLIALENDRTLPVVSAVPYSEKFRRALHRLKFKRKRWLAKPMGRTAARVLPAGFQPDGVVFVPLSRRGRKNRGYDQSEIIAGEIAKSAGLPLLAALAKTRETDAQHRLPWALRQTNVRGAYGVVQNVQGKRLILVDDIVTTGATLRVCAEALYDAGALDVYGMCVADTPLEK